MNKGKSGCCGHPQSCAGTTSTGRCKAREDFEKANNIRVVGHNPELMMHAEDAKRQNTLTPEQRANREKIRKRKERRAERERQRGRDRGLSLGR